MQHKTRKQHKPTNPKEDKKPSKKEQKNQQKYVVSEFYKVR